MAVSRVSAADLEWVVDLLQVRRTSLVDHAPVFWRPATDARDAHRAYLGYLLDEGGALAYRTEDAVLVAAPHGEGWLIDDAHVPQWSRNGAGKDLWNAFASETGGDPVRFVCPVHEPDRTAYASRLGLTLQESWWLGELESSGGEAGQEVELPGADAITVGAPPVYAPGGPVLFLPEMRDPSLAVPAALTRAVELGCAAVVVNQRARDDDMARTLVGAGLRRHCDYLTGFVQHV